MKMHISKEWLKEQILAEGDECCEAGTFGRQIVKLKSGEPCTHKGCLNHVSHPCEVCGRVAGQGEARIFI